jgi:hypothetical protein
VLLQLGAAEVDGLQDGPLAVDAALTESISRGHTVSNAITRVVTIVEAISRAITVRNLTVPPFTFNEVISRAHTIINRIKEDELAMTDAISQSYTLLNKAIRDIPILEVISRAHTVRNDVTAKVVINEAISRATTVLNYAELQMQLESAMGQETAYARCGESIRYRVVGTMSDDNHQGLALIRFDLKFDGGPIPGLGLPQGEPSCDNPMASFAAPFGITGASGYGGTAYSAGGADCEHPSGIPAGVRGIGGAQNTFGAFLRRPNIARFVDCFDGPNTTPTPGPGQTSALCIHTFDYEGDADVDLLDFAAVQRGETNELNGTFLPGVGQPSRCGPAVIAEGTLMAPSEPGEYSLWIEDPVANAAAYNATGVPSWRTRRAIVRTGTPFRVIVSEGRCEATDFDPFFFFECFAGPGIRPNPKLLYISVEECLAQFDDDNDGDVDLFDSASVQRDFRPGACPQQRMVSADPPHCIIDPRQPTSRNGSTRYGYDSVVLNMACPTAELSASDFSVASYGEFATWPAPVVASIEASGRAVALHLKGPIPAGAWTCVTHVASDTRTCLGALPGDMNRDKVVTEADADLLEDWLNNPPMGLPLERCDINRDGAFTAADLTRLEGLFTGDGAFDPWLKRTLGPCPSHP